MEIILPQESRFINDRKIKTIYARPITSEFDYEQIDTIRFITICFIVWGHCLLGWDQKTTNSLSEEILKSFVLQAGRIGTIIFLSFRVFF